MPQSPLLPISLSLSLLSSASGLVLRSYDSASHDRFLNFPASPTHNPGFIHAATDLTGVGWDQDLTNRQFTFVSPKHFVGAKHWMPAIGATIRCLDSNNVLRTYQIASLHSILNDQNDASDLFLGKITTPIAPGDHVSFVPYLKLPNEAAYVGQDLVILGKPALGGIGRIESFLTISEDGVNPTRAFVFRFDNTTPILPPPDASDCHGQSGDSGSPSFVLSSGSAAIVGIHSTIDDPGGDELTYDPFIPHYIDRLNAIMETDGYHMTESVPAATTLSITQTPPTGTIRAGYPFTVGIALENTGTKAANNLKLSDTLPAGTTGPELAGTGWVPGPLSGGVLPALRGGLPAAAISPLTLTLTIPSPGTYQQEIAVAADEFPGTIDIIPLSVIESYLSWSVGLVGSGFEDDDDGDGITNLLEYGFHGDPAENSQYALGTSIAMLPMLEGVPGDNLTFRYLARNDATARGLSYAVEYCDTLGGAWLDATPLLLSSSSTPVTADLDQIALEFAAEPEPRRFFRVQITLTES